MFALGSIRRFELLLVVLVFAFVMQACARFNPIAQADTTQQRALAAYGTMVILVEQAAELLRPGTLPSSVEQRLVVAAESGGLAARLGYEAYQEAEAARIAFEADSTAQGRLTAALNSLDEWVTGADRTINSLKNALRGAQ